LYQRSGISLSLSRIFFAIGQCLLDTGRRFGSVPESVSRPSAAIPVKQSLNSAFSIAWPQGVGFPITRLPGTR